MIDSAGINRTSSVQNKILEKIRQHIGAQNDLVQELADVLQIGLHSAYRRIRSDIFFRLDELEKLVSHYKINLLDDVLETSSSYLFHGADLDASTLDYRSSLHRYVHYINEFKKPGLIKVSYCGIDISPLSVMSSPFLLAFQEYFFNYTIGTKTITGSALLSFSEVDEDLKNLATLFMEFLQTTPSRDILSVLCLNSILGQIQYLKETHRFANQADIDIVYDELDKILDWYELQSANGYRIMKDGTKVVPEVPFSLYNSDLHFSDNNFYIETLCRNFAVVKHNFFSYMFTYHENFVSLNRDLIQAAISKSQPLSATNEKGRIAFFKNLRHRINQDRDVKI
jgi:hypothetical protein